MMFAAHANPPRAAPQERVQRFLPDTARRGLGAVPAHSLTSAEPRRRSRRPPQALLSAALGGSEQLVQECSVHNWNSPLRCDATPNEADNVVVALGKFDAMHIGHRSLAVKASEDGCQPVLLSFSGIAQVLGLPVRLPLVASVDRPRVLSSWAPHCHGRAPRQRMVPFHEIRTMSPERFVAVLAKELGAAGVVAGRNYRFGYKAAGDAQALQELGAQYGMRVHIVDLVSASASTATAATGTGTGTATGTGASSRQTEGGVELQGELVSSSKVRELLGLRDVKAVQRLLGRRYRLVAGLPPVVHSSTSGLHTSLPTQPALGHSNHLNGMQHGQQGVFVPCQTFMNMPPAQGRYFATVTLVQQYQQGSGPGPGINGGVNGSANGHGLHNVPVGGSIGMQQAQNGGLPGNVVEVQVCECEVGLEGMWLHGAGQHLSGLVEDLLSGSGQYAQPAYLVIDFDCAIA